jgi:hypothetical protein
MAIRANVLVPGAGSLVAFLTPDYHPPAETQFFADG